MKAKKDSRVSVRVPGALKTDLERLAARDRRDFTDFIRLLFEHYVQRRKAKRAA